ncbi:MAG: hypothetical protein ACLPRE_05915 [Limisphaerales bacterium]
MSSVEEIERAVERLTPADFDRLASWFIARYHDSWTRRMEHDAVAGKLDFLFEEADTERESGQLHDWPPTEK